MIWSILQRTVKAQREKRRGMVLAQIQAHLADACRMLTDEFHDYPKEDQGELQIVYHDAMLASNRLLNVRLRRQGSPDRINVMTGDKI